MSEQIRQCEKCEAAIFVHSADLHVCSPSEALRRTQMFKTLAALERMANAVTEHLTADKRPSEQTDGPGHDYPSFHAACKACKGVVAYEDYDRMFNSPADTCTCDTISLDDIGIPPDVKAVHAAVRAARVTPPIVACPSCRRPSVVNDPTKLCTLCLRNAQNRNWGKKSHAKYLFEGDVHIRGNLAVDGSTESSPAPRNEDLQKIWETITKHRKALAIIGTLGGFENVGFSQMEPGRKVRSLVELSACRECIGTGWIARDETCTNCNREGYIGA